MREECIQNTEIEKSSPGALRDEDSEKWTGDELEILEGRRRGRWVWIWENAADVEQEKKGEERINSDEST